MARITRLVPPRATALLTECHKLVKEALPPVLKAFVDRVDDAFFELANKADNSQRQQLYFDAMRELRLKRPQLEREFFASIDANLERAVNTPNRALAAVGLESSQELSLLGVDEVEEDLAVTNLIESLETRARQELFALDQRIAHLLSDASHSAGNPFGAQALGQALRALADCLTAGVEVKITLLKLFDRHAATGIQDLYRALNELLVQEGILPKLTPGYARHGAPRTRVIIETDEGTTEAAGDDVFGTLQKLMHNGPAAFNAALGIAGPAGLGTGGAARGFGMPGAGGGIADGGFPGIDTGLTGSAGGLMPGGTAMPTTTFITGLTQLQQGARVSGDFAALANVDPALVANGAVNVIRTMRENGVAAGISDTDTLTLDIVALLFDYILKDASIADAIKALIGRLQIPYLKIALLDKDVFSKKSHPARRLLDAMAEASVGLGESALAHDALYEKIAYVVGRILVDFDSNLELFGQLLGEFESFMADDLASTQRRTEMSTKSLRTREKVVLAKMAVDEAVAQRLKNVETREFVRQFVQDYWRQMLIVTHVENGAESDLWQARLSVIDELVWSVQTKTTPDEKKELTSRLPKLLKQLRGGMHELEMDPVVCSKFLTMLASVHVVSVKQVEEATLAERKLIKREHEQGAALAAEQSEEEFVKQALNRLLSRKSIDVETLDIDLSAFEAAPTAEAAAEEMTAENPDDSEFIEQVMELDLGDWLDLVALDGESVRSRFTYISPVTGRYLFTDRQGNKAFDLNFDELVGFFRRGGANRISKQPDPLFDRAIGELMDRLEHQAVA